VRRVASEGSRFGVSARVSISAAAVQTLLRARRSRLGSSRTRQPSNRAYPAEFKAAVLAPYQERYPDFGPTLAAEKLALDGHVVDHETLRGWLLKAGLWQKRRKRGKHRSWRERRAHFGELVQLDGSHHQWFEKRAPKACLMNMVDDAQGTTRSWLADEETIFAAMQLLWHCIDRYPISAVAWQVHQIRC
jgi:hypothetical protein